MVSGGTYGTEDIVHGAGYGRAILILLLTPILWSLPTAFMIGELSSALPEEGGYYAWVRRAMGNFWGFQEAWLSLVASIFDMAIYPTLFLAYLVRVFPWFSHGYRGIMVGLAVVIVCALLNIAGVKVVSTTSLWLFFLLSAPFALIVVLAPWKLGALANVVTLPTTSSVDITGGLLSAFGMFNALVMSYSRLRLAMAQDGMLPKIFAKLHRRSRAPWVAIITLAICWACCLGLGFERLVTIDILLYGTSLALEFAALIWLRLREPDLPRPFRVPGGMFGTIAVGVFPVLLLGFSVVRSQTEQVLGMSSFAFGMVLIGAGVAAYALNIAIKPYGWTPQEKTEPAA